MYRTIAVVVALLVFVIPATALSQPRYDFSRSCSQLFTVHMATRAARVIYAGTKNVREHALHVLGYLERCQRNLNARWFVRWFDHRQAALWRARRATPKWAIPWPIVQCESGGQNLPPNSASASGYYQILGSTWRDNGGHRPYEAYLHSKREQDAVAARIWDHGNGASQWVCQA